RIRLASSWQIITEAGRWPGVHTRPQRFGAIAICLNRRELGHLHGDRSADLPLERALRDRLVSSGAAQEHRWRPNSGWVTIPLDRERDVFEVIALLRINYERARAAAMRRPGALRRLTRPQPQHAVEAQR
ncbi:MAG TPA: luciferase family protein, partial [Solirubrobacteraceae bacterium]|nr:luciferase family protein [Solirubrobacteraceae bacterium]